MTKIPWVSFAEKVAPIEALCRRIIVRHGGTARAGRALRELAPGSVMRGGYVMPRPITADSELDYAFRVLNKIARAKRAADPDNGRKYAWEAAIELQDAAYRFSTYMKATHAAARRRRIDADDRAAGWARDMARLMAATSRITHERAYQMIAHGSGVHPGTVKRALRTRHTRPKK